MKDWDHFLMGLAAHWATRSKDPSTQVGCVLVNHRRHTVGSGYNGFPRGVTDDPARLNDRPTKYLMIQHAEINAILNSETNTRGCTAFITAPPCASCAGALIQAGIVRIVTREPSAALRERFAASFEAAGTMLREAGVEIVYLGADE